MSSCKHPKNRRITTYLFPQEKPSAIVSCNLCQKCGAWLSLGPASDASEAVKIEQRAAQIAADPDVANMRCRGLDDDNCARCGWDDYPIAYFYRQRSVGFFICRTSNIGAQGVEYNAAWLARCIVEHVDGTHE